MDKYNSPRRSPCERRKRGERRRRSNSSDSYTQNRARNYSIERRKPLTTRRNDHLRGGNPEKSNCLAVFGMSTRTTEAELRDLFSKYGPIETVNLIVDKNTGSSRGFAFIYFKSLNHAQQARERCNDLEIEGKRIRVDYSLTKKAHSPTPGQYLGNRERQRGRDRDRTRRGYRSSQHRHGDYYSRERERTHSRRRRSYSRSPRR